MAQRPSGRAVAAGSAADGSSEVVGQGCLCNDSKNHNFLSVVQTPQAMLEDFRGTSAANISNIYTESKSICLTL